MSKWSELFLDRRSSIIFLSFLFGMIAASCWFSAFLLWNEQRTGYVFNDPVLMYFLPHDYSILIGLLTNVSIFTCILLLLNRPTGILYFLSAGIIMIIIRSITLYFLPLEPPSIIIPLKDPILEMTFYNGEVLVRDLFFSGHTANIILMGLLSEKQIVKRIIIFIGLIVGVLLILQHVHYSIDVFFAPFFAVLVYKMSVTTVNNLFDINNDQIKRCGNIIVELGFKNK